MNSWINLRSRSALEMPPGRFMIYWWAQLVSHNEWLEAEAACMRRRFARGGLKHDPDVPRHKPAKATSSNQSTGYTVCACNFPRCETICSGGNGATRHILAALEIGVTMLGRGVVSTGFSETEMKRSAVQHVGHCVWGLPTKTHQKGTSRVADGLHA